MNMVKELRPQRQLSEKWKLVPNNAQISGPGCVFECIYCNQEGLDNDPTGKKNTPYITTTVDSGISLNDKVYVGSSLVMEIGQSELIDELKRFPYYDKAQTIMIRNFSEPALNWSQSLDLAQLAIDKLEHQGPIMFITKGRIDQVNVLRARGMVENGAKLVFVVTNAGNPKVVEKAPREGRVETTRLLSAENIPAILSMRPLIVGVNTDPETIENTLTSVAKYIEAVTVGGLFVYDFTIERFRKIGIELGDFYKKIDQFRENKLLPDYVPPLVRKMANEIGLAAPIYDHTTCATAYVVQKRYGVATQDRLAHWSGQSPIFSDCNNYCPVVQRRLCIESSHQDVKRAIEAGTRELTRLGFNFHLVVSPNKEGTLLIKEGDLHLSELFFVMEKTGLNVENLPTFSRTEKALDELTFAGNTFKIEQTECGYNLYPSRRFLNDEKEKLMQGLWKKTRSRAFVIVDP